MTNLLIRLSCLLVGSYLVGAGYILIGLIMVAVWAFMLYQEVKGYL